MTTEVALSLIFGILGLYGGILIAMLAERTKQ